MTYIQVEFPLFVIAIIANISLGIIVLRYSPKSVSRYLFGAFVLSQVFWIGTNFAAFVGNNFLWLARLTMLFAALHAFFFFLFIYTFLEKRKVLTSKLLTPLIVFLVVIIALTLSPLIFEKLEPNQSGSLGPKPGPAIPFFGIFVGGCILWAFYSLVKKYQKSEGVEKLQWRYLSFGLVFTFLLVLVFSFFNYVIFEDLSTVRLGHLYTLPFIVFTTYAMVKHRLLNLKAILAELAVILLNITIFIQLLTSESVRQILVNGVVLIGTIVTGLLVIRGVTKEIKQREQLQELSEKLQKANTELESLSRFKSQMLALSAHQIKAPLATIKGFASIIMDGIYGPINDKIKETLQKMKNSADELINLINTLLDLRKVEEGKMDYKFENVKIKDLVQNVIDGLKVQADAKKLEFSFTSGTEASVSADPQKLKQVLANLVENSIKYTPQGFVKVETKEENGYVTFSVTDSGLGIGPTLLPHLFDQEFIRDERVKKEIKGTGLGLYIAKRIVTDHAGTIWAESPGEGKGSKFFVKLRKIT
ncbi:MAG: Uncharacterized protein G01um101420_633 [Parcubacteria group bacterium Gr01-1014_20]|nr:MAG: Uncharacterized protein G01um101420_633 [Parcubacteria group bacterium Gr01-1014_20]